LFIYTSKKFVPSNFWNADSNRREYVDWLAEQLNISYIDEWYNVDQETFVKYGGARILFCFGNSISKLLMNVYPFTCWQLWRFDVIPKNFWHSVDNRNNYIDWLCDKLHISSAEDWYGLTWVYNWTILIMMLINHSIIRIKYIHSMGMVSFD
jgi:hypothetical protein